jgi:hypothetical protein
MKVLRQLILLLRERWPWWVIPLVVMILLTLLLRHFGRGTSIAPFDYGIGAGSKRALESSPTAPRRDG